MRPDERRFMDETQASPEAVDRVIDRLDPPFDLKALLSQLPEPSPHQAIRVRNRVLLGKNKSRSFPWLSAGLALAAALLLVWRLTIPTPVDPVPESAPVAQDVTPLPVEAPIALLSESLVDSGALQEITPVSGLKLRFEGTGEISGSEQAPHIQWFGGRIEVDVDPQAGLAMSIETAEGRVEVLGTVFDLERSALGTTVGVSHGKVQLDCQDGSSHTLVSDARALCLPVTGAGMLGRARALSTDPEAVLQAIERGEELGSSPAIRSELLALEVDTLAGLGRNAEALVRARKYLEMSGPREMEVLRTAANLSLQEEGCLGALPYLERLAPTQPDAASYYVECKARTRTETHR